jgi:D-3-phosphoglycerate dehydrogenase / 2-oxoglutarate reductase
MRYGNLLNLENTQAPTSSSLMKLFFDFDSTFVQSETLDVLAAILIDEDRVNSSVLSKIASITDQAMSGELDFHEALIQRLACLPLTKRDMSSAIKRLSTQVAPSIEKNKAWFLSNKANIYIVSGGFKEIIIPVVAPYGILPEHIFANDFVYDAFGKMQTACSNNPLAHSAGKATVISRFKKQPKKEPFILVGDGYNDYQVKEKGCIDQFYAYVENVKRESVMNAADEVVHDCDELINLLEGFLLC